MGPSSTPASVVRFPALRRFALAGCLLGSSLLTAGCAPVSGVQAGPNGSDPGAAAATYELKRPSFTDLAPTNVALGDEVRVFGADFIDPEHGELSLYMMGTFTDAAGNQTRVDGLTVPLTYLGPGQAKFEFGPEILFAPTGRELGSFSGNFQVISRLTGQALNAEAGDQEISDAHKLQMQAKPSIIEQMRAVDGNCDPVTKATTAQSNLAIGVKAVGMTAATDVAPIKFTYTFTSPGLTAAYVENKLYNAWPYTGSGAPTPAADTQTGTFSFSFDVTSGTSAVVDPQHQEQVVTVSPPVTVSQAAANQTVVKLARLAAGKYDQPGNTSFTLIVRAEHSNGTTISRTIVFPVWNQIELPKFNGTSVLKEIYSAEITDVGCVSGGNRPLNYQYSEGSSESKSRTVNMSWNTNYSKSFGLQEGVSVGANLGLGEFLSVNTNVSLNANNSWTWSQTFGVDVSETISTETHKNGSYTTDIIPTQFAVSYKQPTRYERKVPVIFHSACGASGPIGDAVLTDWKWNFSVNSGPTCEPPPATTLPPAQKF